MKYEYKHIRTNHLLTKDELNREGDARWELVSVIVVCGEVFHTFKRVIFFQDSSHQKPVWSIPGSKITSATLGIPGNNGSTSAILTGIYCFLYHNSSSVVSTLSSFECSTLIVWMYLSVTSCFI